MKLGPTTAIAFLAVCAYAAAQGKADGAPKAAEQPNELRKAAKEAAHIVIDLSSGPSAARFPVFRMDSLPDLAGPGGAAYRTSRIVLKFVPPGSFVMGSPQDEPGRMEDESQRNISFPRGFYLGLFEVTQQQWINVTGALPAKQIFTNSGNTFPVHKVSWNDIRGDSSVHDWPRVRTVDPRSFIGILRAQTGLAFDLPTEAQWEYSCRAGEPGAIYCGTLKPAEESPELDRIAWHFSNSGNTVHGTGLRSPNKWQLYDCTGNVWEWCLDWYAEAYKAKSAVSPNGAAAGTSRVKRGGSWFSRAKSCRSAQRDKAPPHHRSDTLGFRVCLP